MIPSIEKLVRLESPPSNPKAPGTAEKWREFESRLGLRLPNDYREFTRIYGVGHWFNFVEIMNPFQPWQHTKFADFYGFACKRLEGLDEGFKFRREFSAPFVGYPSQNGLLPFAFDDAGGTLCWQVKGHPDTWPIVCLDASKSNRFDRFDLSLTGFLGALLNGEIFPRTFEDAVFPIRPPAFRPGEREINAVLGRNRKDPQ